MKLLKNNLLFVKKTKFFDNKTKMMRAVSFKPPGAISDLSIIQVLMPSIRENECLIKVKYTGLNRADLLQRQGKYPVPAGESETLGLECSGIIEESKSPLWKKGDRVMGLLGGGGYAEYARINHNHLLNIPSQMSFKQAAALPEAWLTAFQLIYWIGDIKTRLSDASELSYLVHAGASGVGTSLIQIIKMILQSENLFVTVGSEEKKKFLNEKLSVNPAFIINYKTQDFKEEIQRLTNSKGVDYIFDCVGGSYWDKNVDSLAQDGIWALYGLMGQGSVNGDLLARLMRKRGQIRSTTLRSRSIDYKKELIQDFNKTLMDRFVDGTLETIIDSEFDIEQVQKAHERMETNQNVGKIVLKISE
jgi:tumor protein p53-inducible protein 3